MAPGLPEAAEMLRCERLGWPLRGQGQGWGGSHRPLAWCIRYRLISSR